MTDEPSINFKPSQNDLNEIEDWLSEEYRNSGEGFYCNWSIIRKSYNENNLITFNIANKPIGFLIFYKFKIHVYIEIFDIHPDYRKKGIGRAFFKQFSKFMSSLEFKLISLNCAPINSKGFWEKMGFLPFPQRGLYGDVDAYFKPLIKVADFTDNTNEGDIIELWNDNYYNDSISISNWAWRVDIGKNGNLKAPIVYPTHPKYHIRWKNDGAIIKETMVRNFQPNNHNILYSDFLFIDKLVKE